MDLLKTIGVRVVTAGVALGVLVAVVAWWRLDDASQQAILGFLGRIIGWFVLVLALPWLAFALVGWVARRESNAAGAVLVAGMTLLEGILLVGLVGVGAISGAAGAVLAGAAIAVAGLYNLLSCDFIADRLER